MSERDTVRALVDEAVCEYFPVVESCPPLGDDRCWTCRTREALAALLAEAERPAVERTNGMNLRDFSRINRVRCESPVGFNHRLDSWSLSDWFTAVVGELGEAANVAKKLNRVRDGVPGNKEKPEQLRAKLKQEVADAVIYLDLLAQSQGFDLSEAVAQAFNAKSDELGMPIRYQGADPPAYPAPAKENNG